MTRMVQTAADIIAANFKNWFQRGPRSISLPLFDVAMIDACVRVR